MAEVLREFAELEYLDPLLLNGLESVYAGSAGLYRSCFYNSASSQRYKINADGKPIQYVLRLDQKSGACGFILDPMLVESLGQCTARKQRSRILNLIDDVSAAFTLPRPEQLREVIVPILLGQQATPLEATQSALWIAVASANGKQRLKVYVSLDGLTLRERWQRFGRLLTGLGRYESLKAFCSATRTVTHQSIPVAVGIDFDRDNKAMREKLYVQNAVCDNSWLNSWYKAIGDRKAYEAMLDFQRLCGLGGHERFYAGSFFIAANFSGSSGSARLKTDIPVCRWLGHINHSLSLINLIADRFDLRTPPYVNHLAILNQKGRAATEEDIANEVATPTSDHSSRAAAVLQLAGLGFAENGEPYINLYIRPPDSPVYYSSTH